MPAPDTTCAEGGWIERLGLRRGGDAALGNSQADKSPVSGLSPSGGPAIPGCCPYHVAVEGLWLLSSHSAPSTEHPPTASAEDTCLDLEG